MKYRLDKGNHSVYSLQFHYVSCVKYRQKVLVGDVANKLKSINIDVAKAFGIKIIEQETSTDHIHILFSSKPQIQLSKFVNSLKSVLVGDSFSIILHTKRRMLGAGWRECLHTIQASIVVFVVNLSLKHLAIGYINVLSVIV